VRVVVTRPAGRGEAFLARLREAGHDVSHVPLTAVEDGAPFPDPAPFDGVLFTSASAVERAPAGATWPRVGAVGAATAEALRARRIAVDVVGDGGGAALARAWGGCRGQRLLLPQAADAHPALAAALRAAGAEVTCAAVYRTVPVVDVDRDALANADVLCFFAPSQVRAFETLGIETKAAFWAHGPTTRAAIRDRPVMADDELFR